MSSALTLTGLKVDPSDQDLIRIFDLAASRNKPAWLPVGNFYSKNPAVLLAGLKPTSEIRQLYLIWGPVMHGNEMDRPIPGGAVYKQSGDPVKIMDEISGHEIGSCKVFYLWQFGHSTPWCLKEYRSCSPEFKDNPFAVYSLSFRSDSYVRAETKLLKAEKDFIKSSTPLKPNLKPATPLRRPTRARAKSCTALRKKEICAKASSVETRADSDEFVQTQVASANEMLNMDSRTAITSFEHLVEDSVGKEIGGCEFEVGEPSNCIKDSELTAVIDVEDLIETGGAGNGETFGSTAVEAVIVCAKDSSVETRADSDEFVQTQVSLADEMLNMDSRTPITSFKHLVEDSVGKEIGGCEFEVGESSNCIKDSELTADEAVIDVETGGAGNGETFGSTAVEAVIDTCGAGSEVISGLTVGEACGDTYKAVMETSIVDDAIEDGEAKIDSCMGDFSGLIVGQVDIVKSAGETSGVNAGKAVMEIVKSAGETSGLAGEAVMEKAVLESTKDDDTVMKSGTSGLAGEAVMEKAVLESTKDDDTVMKSGTGLNAETWTEVKTFSLSLMVGVALSALFLLCLLGWNMFP